MSITPARGCFEPKLALSVPLNDAAEARKLSATAAVSAALLRKDTPNRAPVEARTPSSQDRGCASIAPDAFFTCVSLYVVLSFGPFARGQ